MRSDGRAPDQLRPVRLLTNFTENPLASVLCEFGATKVLCTVSNEESVPRFQYGTGRGWVTAEYSLLPGSTDRRVEREAARGRQSGRTLEIQRLIGRALRAVVDTKGLGERTLWVDCDVLQADGGTRTASITGGYTALALALSRLVRRGALDRAPLRDSIAAVSVGMVDGEVVLDLSYEEDFRADVDMNVVATGGGRLAEIQGTARFYSHSFDSDPVYYAADKDYVWFEITRLDIDVKRTITFTTDPVTNTLTLLELYDDAGSALDVSGTEELIWQPVDAGRYFLSVSPLTTTFGCANSVGYNLRAEKSVIWSTYTPFAMVDYPLHRFYLPVVVHVFSS